MRDILGLALIAGASWTLGSPFPAASAFPELREFERVALRLLLGLGFTALLASGLGLAGAFRAAPAALGILAVTGPALALARGTFRRTAVDTIEASPVRIAPGAALLIAAAAIACAGAVAPVTDDDALAYVIPIARHIADAGRIVVWPDQARSMWPLSQQALLAVMLEVGGERLGFLTAFEWLLALGTISALARSVCGRRDHAVPAIVIALGAPVVAFQVASAKEDLLVVAATAATGLCLAAAAGAGANRRYLCYAGLFAGIAAGAKYPGAAIAAGAVAWAFAGRAGSRLRDAGVVALCACCTGGLWYALNLWRYGNPVAPFVLGARGTVLDAAAVEAFVNSYGAGRGPAAFALAPIRIFLEPSLFCGRANLFNPLAYAALPALLVPTLRRRHAPLFVVAAVLYLVWFATLQNARLLLPATVLLAPAAADVLMPLVRRRAALRGAAWGIALVTFGIVGAVGSLRFERYITAPHRFLAMETQNYDDLVWMSTHLDAAGSRVASDHKALDHLRIPWLFLDPTYQVEISRTELNDPGRLAAALKRQGITHLFGNAKSFLPLRDHLRLVHENDASRLGGVRFFREPPSERTAVFELF